jgi:hypothetical protein
VRLGLLPVPQGRGRGSGAEANPKNCALLIIAVLATDNLSDTDGRVIKLANAKFDASVEPCCLLTGKDKFVDALAFALGARDLARKLHVSVSRTSLSARMYYYRGRRRYLDASYFGRDLALHDSIEVTATLSSEAIKTIWRTVSTLETEPNE